MGSGEMRVPFANIVAENAPLRADFDAAIARVIDSGRFILGPEVDAFEAELAAVVGAKHAVGVSSGTDALLLALMALGIGFGDEVITTPFTFFATAGVVARLGATPVFVDIDEQTMCIDPEAAAAAVTERTRAMIVVSLFGRPADLPVVSVPVVDDAAQAVGCSGPRTLCSTYSFFPAKVIGALGDAGALVTDDADFAARVNLLRGHGASPKYFHASVGGNFRLDALQAALLRVKLERLDEYLRQRRRVAAAYRQTLPKELRCQTHHTDHVYNYFAVRAPRRDELRNALARAGVSTAVYYPRPLHLQECFANLRHTRGAFPVAERTAEEVLALPCYPELTDAQVGYVAEQIKRFYQ